jgi:hypothetical protein
MPTAFKLGVSEPYRNASASIVHCMTRPLSCLVDGTLLNKELNSGNDPRVPVGGKE